MSAYFITLEGGEGAGKSTISRTVKRWLNEHEYSIVSTREPGGTPLAERLRAILLDKQNTDLSAHTELLLMFAARAQHLHQVIRPALAENKVVLCDRFTDATYAYQGGGREFDLRDIAQLEQLVHGDLQPDLTLLLDVPAKLGLRRASRRSAPDRFERESIAFFERVRAAYLQRAKLHPERFVVVDASQSLKQVKAEVLRTLEQRLQ